jgi:hypothetical protein
VFRQDDIAAAEQTRALHGIAQLTHVARPCVTLKTVGDAGGKPGLARCEMSDEVRSQRKDFLRTLAERRILISTFNR